MSFKEQNTFIKQKYQLFNDELFNLYLVSLCEN
jgi:hypothetical protein